MKNSIARVARELTLTQRRQLWRALWSGRTSMGIQRWWADRFGPVGANRRKAFRLPYGPRLELLEARQLLSALGFSGGSLAYTGSAAGNTVTIAASAANYVFTDSEAIALDASAIAAGWTQSNGGLTVTGPAASVTAGMTINGGSGDDTLIIQNPTGGLLAPTGGIAFNGNGGFNTLEVQGGSATTGATSGPAHADPNGFTGTLIHTNGATVQTINYTGLAPISDTMPTTNYTFNLFADTQVNVVDGPVVGGLQTTEINCGSSGTFEKVDLANKTHVTINGGTSLDTITINYGHAAVGLTTLDINAQVGTNPVTIQATPAGVTTNVIINTGISNNALPNITPAFSTAVAINVGNSGSVQGIQGTLNLESPGGANAIVLDDSNDTTARTATLSTLGTNPSDSESNSDPYGQVTGLAPAAINYEYADTSALTLHGGVGGGTVNVQATAAGVTTSFVGHGISTINVGNSGSVQGILGTLNLSNPPAFNTIVVEDSADSTARTATLSDASNTGQVTGLAPAAINYGDFDTAGITVMGGTGGNTFNVQATSAFFTTAIDSGSGNDTINVSSDAPTNSGNLDGIGGALSLDVGAGTNSINLSDSGQATTADSNVVVTASQITGLTGAAKDQTINYAATGGTATNTLTLTGSSTLANTFNFQATNALFSTTLTGGAANDTFNLGSTANSLSGLAGALTVNGVTHAATTTTAAASTPVAAAVVIGDTLNLNDQGDAGDNTYSIGATTLTRTGAATVTLHTIQTLALNTSTGNNTATVTVTPTGVDHLLLNGNSTAATSDTFNVQRTGSGTVTEVTGGAGNDVFTVSSAANNLDYIAGVISVNGGTHLTTTTTAAAGTQVATDVVIGDTLNISDASETGSFIYGLGANLFSTAGVGGVAYHGIQTLDLYTSTGTDTTNIGTAKLPTGNGTGANPTGGAPSADHVVVTGNSLATKVNTVNVRATAAGSVTEVTTGAGNDIVNAGYDPTVPANSLANLLGVVSIDGAAHTSATTTAATGTPVATSVLVGNTLNLDDQGDSGNYSYGIGTALLTRSGVAGLAYSNFQTLVLNTSTGNDTIADGATTLPAATPATVNLSGGASAADHVTIIGNSSPTTADTFNLQGTASTTLTEITGGAGSDTFNVTATPGLGTSINGGAPTTSPGDMLNFDAAGGTITYGIGTVQGGSNQTVAYQSIESFPGVTDTNGQAVINETTGNDTLLVKNNGSAAQFTLNNGTPIVLPAGLTQATFNGNGGTDLMTVDYSGGALPFNLADNGTGDTGAILAVKGDGSTTTALYTPDATTPGNGTVGINSTQTITFNGLAPLDLSGMATATVSMPNAGSIVNVQLSADFATQQTSALRISGTSGGVAFETVAAFNNTSLVLDTSTVPGNDTITLHAITGLEHDTNLTVTTGTGTDTIDVTGSINLPGNLSLQSGQDITLGNAFVQTGGTQSYQGTVSTGAGTTTLTSTNNQAITFNGAIRPGGNGATAELDLVTTAVTTPGLGTTYIADLNGGSSADVVSNTAASGGIDLSGVILNLNVISSAGGDVYTIVSSPSGGITGTFIGFANGVTLGAGGRSFLIQYSPTAVTLTDTQTPTVSVTDAGGVYNGTPFAATDAAVTGIAPDGILAGFGDATLSYTYLAVSGKTRTQLPGAPTAVGTYAVVAHYASNNPYYFSADSDPVDFSITPATLNVTTTALDKVYTSTIRATVTLQDNRLGTDDLTLSYLSATFNNKNVGTAKTVTVNGISISGGANAADYTLGNTTATTTATITPATLTVTASGINKVYDNTLAATVTLLDNRLGRAPTLELFTYAPVRDQLTLTYNATFADPNAGTGKTVSVSGIAITGGADAGNYTLGNTTTTTTADITPAPLTLTANPGQSKVYGQVDPALTYSLTTGALVGTDALSGNPTRLPGANVGTYAIGQGTVSAGNNYAITFVADNLAITPAPLTITADNQTKVFAAALPMLTASYSGLVNGDTAASLTTAPTLSTTATATSTPSGNPYSITAAGAVDSNYTITYVPGSLVVGPNTTTTVLVTSTDPAAYLAPVTFTAVILSTGPAATGTVSFSEGSTVLGTGTLDAQGHATFTTSSIFIGSHWITATYNGDTTWLGSTAPAINQLIGTPHQRYVELLYEDLLHRQADLYGMNIWAGMLDNGQSYNSVATQFASKPEYDADVITSLYVNCLGRQPDAPGLALRISQMQAGMNATDLQAILLGSPEFFARAGGNNTAYVTALYQTVLQRTPDPAMANWITILTTGLDTIGGVARRIVLSDESRGLIINTMYGTYLGRTSDPQSLVIFKNLLTNGISQPDLIADFVASPEFLQINNIV